ncbi:hypothetical protein L1787_12010 [Acuticoccus sp. M5D2P5]|uniref:hypothetical protein n=1 Tax=Acuticoccus kalidii TaxID=2910977 RepID=UPI001F2B25AE|nr:hypothetical protein [Acuticoccus kalidii]MCF3934138.1 hypothetical protein [Acuticoccus kalidii]
MSIRTTEFTVTFHEAFRVAESEELLPPGTYRVITDDEELPGLSFIAYRRIATLLMIPSIDTPQQHRRTALSISQTELDAAIMKDRHQTV